VRNDHQGKLLFTSAALFNWLVGVSLLAMPASLSAQFGIPWPWESALAQMGCLAVVLFGWAYWKVARDPDRYRPYVTPGIIGKALTVVVLYGNWLGGNLPSWLAALSTVDAIYAVLFAGSSFRRNTMP
jgi:hypothetical protein